MFSAQIVSSDSFLEMPISSQGLYFHLGMSADDDGFVTPRKILRMIGASEDDLKILIVKGFVIPFESGVVVVTHWKQNNYIQNDRFTPSIYRSEKSQLSCIQNVYTLYTSDIQNVSRLDTQVRKGGSIGREEERNTFEKNEDRIAEAKRIAISHNVKKLLGKSSRTKTAKLS